MDSRGFTLLEVLIALAVLAVMASLALPAVWSRMDGAKLNAAARQVESAVVSVRASALREGVALALVGVRDERGVQLRIEALVAEGEEAGGRDGEIRTRRSLGVLPKEVGIGPVMEQDEMLEGPLEAEDRGVLDGPDDLSGDQGDEAPVRLVVALPDGSMLASGPLELWIGERAQAQTMGQMGSTARRVEALRIQINRWTGVCSITAAPMPAGDAPVAGAAGGGVR